MEVIHLGKKQFKWYEDHELYGINGGLLLRKEFCTADVVLCMRCWERMRDCAFFSCNLLGGRIHCDLAGFPLLAVYQCLDS
ncbi:unnamed protein product [Caretta caretta]